MDDEMGTSGSTARTAHEESTSEAQVAPRGLTTAEARARLAEYGPNALPEERPQAWRQLAKRFWGPVPWMLEAALVLELVLGRHVQAAVIAALLVTNAVIAFVQERRANEALAMLKERLEVQARVCRDGVWALLSAKELVPGDLVHLRAGDFVPADGKLEGGPLLLETSALTGESLPRESAAGEKVLAGSIVARGEADFTVEATGAKTCFGKTAELVRIGEAPGHVERVVVAVARALVVLDLALVLTVVAYALSRDLDPKEIIPYCLILLVASVPVALPATFSLALALGSRELAQDGIWVTRLPALEDVAGMEVLCSDKTGTLTRNQLEVSAAHPFGSFSADDVLSCAALASDAATQDPLDLAILRARPGREVSERIQFLPFDPATRRSEALLRSERGTLRVIKGAPRTLAELVSVAPAALDAAVEALARDGQRVLAVARGWGAHLELVGLVGLMDAVREDSAESVARLHALGVRVVIATGDSLPTAVSVAGSVGITGKAVVPSSGASEKELCEAEVLAGVYPEDKFRLVKAHQKAARIVGMTGDGVNDAPALKQAEVGVAVSNAVDVAKAAASLVLTRPGLSGIERAVWVGRGVFQRMRTYTLNKVVKTLQVSVYLTLGLFWTGEMVVTPRLILLLLFANDFVTMSLSTDNVMPSRRPEKWDMAGLLKAAAGLGAGWLVFAFAGLWLGKSVLHLGLAQLQTLGFLMLVFTGQATVYLARERRRFWKSLPGRALLTATLVDLVIVIALALSGTSMAAAQPSQVFGLLGAVVLAMFALDELKARLLRAAS